jgi:hypothetical protein
VRINRRDFVRSAALASAGALSSPIQQGSIIASAPERFRPDELPSARAVWEWQVWMAGLGPKYTGNDAHRTFVEFLARELKSARLDVARDSYTFTRWEATRHELTVTAKGAQPRKVPVTSDYPYSGRTGPRGVTGELVYGGSTMSLNVPDDLTGRILLIDAPTLPAPSYREGRELLGVWGEGTELPSSRSGALVQNRSAEMPPSLTGFAKAGAVGVVFAWTDVSDENAAYQYIPWSRPLQGTPALWVGRESGAKLRDQAARGARVTLTLEAALLPETRTDALVAVLPGASSQEALVIHTHTDGTNAVEENGGLGIVALAKYFAKLPVSARNRTLVFVLVPGHFARAYVPSMNGFIDRHPEIVQNAVGALCIEHLGCREWKDNSAMQYRPTGRDELSLVMTNVNSATDIVRAGVAGTADRRGVVLKTSEGFAGEGRFLAGAGVPTIGYIPIPDYLAAAAPNGCIDKVSRSLMYGQIQAFAKMIHTMDALTGAQLKG